MAFPVLHQRMGQRGREFHVWIATCVGLGVKRYVELGSWDGSSAAFAKEAGIEKVATIDLLPNRPTTLREDVKYITADSHSDYAVEEALKFLGGYPDAVFIDADHEGDAPRRDFDLWWPKATKVVGFHDIFELPGVAAVWREVSKQYRSIEVVSQDTFSRQEFHHNSEIWGRIGILFKE